MAVKIEAKKRWILLPLLFVFLTGSPSWGSPRWMRLSWTVPDAADTTMTVSWNDSDLGDGAVEYRPLGGTSATTAASAVDTGVSTLEVTYEATLSGLRSSAVYEYRVQSGGDWSDWKRFDTPPVAGSCDHVRIVVGGDGNGGDEEYDPGYTSRHWDDMAGYVKDESPLLMVHSGDLVYDGREHMQWEEWFTVSEFLTAEIPFMPVPGHQDDGPLTGHSPGDNKLFNMMFALPLSGAGELDERVDPNGDGVEDFWSVVVGNVLLVGLSTEGIDPAVQHAFLRGTLDEWGSSVEWKMVIFHRPLWSSGFHGSNDGDMLDAGSLIGIIDDYSVDFIIGGHDHHYERLHPSSGGYGGRPRAIHPLPDDGGNSGVADGTIHVVSGGLGSLADYLTAFPGCRTDGCFVAEGHMNYMVFDIEGYRADVVVRGGGGIQAYTNVFTDAALELDPLDTFTVVKADSRCGSPPDDVPEEVDVPEPTDRADIPDSADWDGEAPPDAPDAASDVTGEDGDEGPGADNGCSCVVAN